MKDSWKQHLEEPQFQRLKPYLYDLETCDLAHFLQEELVDMADERDRAMMKVFTIRYIFPYSKQKNTYHPMIPFSKELGCYENCLISSTIQSHHSPDKMNMATLHTQLSSGDETIIHLNLSHNELQDFDLYLIASIVKKLPSLKMVDLSHNQFAADSKITRDLAVKAILSILDQPITYLILCGNPLVKESNQPHMLFSKLSPNHLQKLIWLPDQVHLIASYWKSCIHNLFHPDSKHLEQVVKETHLAYFEMQLALDIESSE